MHSIFIEKHWSFLFRYLSIFMNTYTQKNSIGKIIEERKRPKKKNPFFFFRLKKNHKKKKKIVDNKY